MDGIGGAAWHLISNMGCLALRRAGHEMNVRQQTRPQRTVAQCVSCTIDLAVDLLVFTPHALELLWGDHDLLLSIDWHCICTWGRRVAGDPPFTTDPTFKGS